MASQQSFFRMGFSDLPKPSFLPKIVKLSNIKTIKVEHKEAKEKGSKELSQTRQNNSTPRKLVF